MQQFAPRGDVCQRTQERRNLMLRSVLLSWCGSLEAPSLPLQSPRPYPPLLLHLLLLPPCNEELTSQHSPTLQTYVGKKRLLSSSVWRCAPLASAKRENSPVSSLRRSEVREAVAEWEEERERDREKDDFRAQDLSRGYHGSARLGQRDGVCEDYQKFRANAPLQRGHPEGQHQRQNW